MRGERRVKWGNDETGVTRPPMLPAQAQPNFPEQLLSRHRSTADAAEVMFLQQIEFKER
jgi:hypothetical protein